MNTKDATGFFIIAILICAVFGAMTPTAIAACNNGSVKVAFVPSPNAASGGTLPTAHAAFSGYSFTNVPIANVDNTTLASYDTVVLMRICTPMTQFSAQQRSDLINWVSNGGKLIIYDTECFTNGIVNYSWLPCKATSYSPGAWGATKNGYPWVDLTILEDNTLADSDPTSPNFINVSKIAYETDAAGDQNVFIANETCWCGAMEGTNVLDANGTAKSPGTTGFVHAYQHYDNGLIIYNGLDIDDISTDPTSTTGRGYLAKIWLLELNQTWDNTTGTELCGLPCTIIIPTPPPTSEPEVLVPAMTPLGLLALIGVLSVITAVSIGLKKRH